jgi:hypothetical protein
MIKRDSLSLFSCLPLMVLMFWQGSSCNSTKANKNSAGNDNHSVNSNRKSMQSSDVKGTWGADGISMEVTDSGTEIRYVCAHGSITEKIVLDCQGHFSVRGRHVRERPGPTRIDEDQNGEPATYRGAVNGDTMNLTVILSNSNETVGTFTLTHGRSGRLRRCA